MTPPILDEPIRGAVQQRRKSRSQRSGVAGLSRHCTARLAAWETGKSHFSSVGDKCQRATSSLSSHVKTTRKPPGLPCKSHRTTWWQQHRNHVAASWRESRASLRSLPPGPRAGILRYWQTCSLPGHPVYLLGMLHDHRARKRCFWHALAELRRLKLISEGRLPNPWKRS